MAINKNVNKNYWKFIDTKTAIENYIANSVSQHLMHSEVTKLEKETFDERSGFIVPRQYHNITLVFTRLNN